MQTERVTYLTSAEQKAALEAFAKAQGKSVGNIVREATERYINQAPQMSTDEEEALKLLVAELNDAVPRMHASLERSIEKLRSTREELDRTFREAGLRA